MTPDSDLSNKNRAVPLAYAWGNANVDELKKSVATLKSPKMSCVHLNHLVESFRLGIANFVEGNGQDLECVNRMKKHYAHLNTETISLFNEINA